MSSSRESYSVKWEDYKNSIAASFGALRQDKHLFDVTLVTDDETVVSAHKIVLSATSSFFKSLFKRVTQKDPVIYLGSVSGKNLNYILDYVYSGETKMIEEDLEAFMVVAQSFKVSGLYNYDCRGSSIAEKDKEHPNQVSSSKKNCTMLPKREIPEIQIDDNQIVEIEEISEVEKTLEANPVITEVQGQVEHDNEHRDPSPVTKTNLKDANTVPIQNGIKKIKVSSEEEVDRIIEESLVKKEGFTHCTYCSYSSKFKANAKKHIETHLEGLTYTCTVCERQYSTRSGMYQHQRIHTLDED